MCLQEHRDRANTSTPDLLMGWREFESGIQFFFKTLHIFVDLGHMSWG